MSEAPTLVEAGRQQAAGLAVAAMYERHSRTLFGLCRMLLRDPHEAEDALQATFLAAHGAMLRGSAPRDEAAWLATIARNECRGRIRDRMRAPTHGGDAGLESVPDPGPAPEEQLRDPEVSRALAQLPESQREAVVLHDVFGFKAREVGKVLGMSVPAVEALLFRGRRQLRLRLRPAHGALVVPVGVRDALTQTIPGFAGSDAGAAVVGGAGLAGAGLLAKLAGAPAAAKVAAGVAAVATAGSVAVVETERARDDRQRPTLVRSGGGGVSATGEPVGSGSGSGSGTTTRDSDASGSGPGSSDTGSGGSSGPGDGDDRRDDDDAGDDGARAGGTSGSGSGSQSAGPDDDGGGDDDGGESGESRSSGSGSGASGGGSGSAKDDDRGSGGKGSDDAEAKTAATTEGDDDAPDDGSGGSGSGATSGSDGADPDDRSGSGSDDRPSSGSGSGSGSDGSSSGSGGGTDDGAGDEPDDEPDAAPAP